MGHRTVGWEGVGVREAGRRGVCRPGPRAAPPGDGPQQVLTVLALVR